MNMLLHCVSMQLRNCKTECKILIFETEKSEFYKWSSNEEKNKKYKIISHIVWMVIVITLISIIVSMNDKKIYRGARYLESPDGQYVIYQDGGDQDIFGNSSGYMHYALEYDNVYSRVFYGYKEIYTPQIEWYNDGFLYRTIALNARKVRMLDMHLFQSQI